MKNASKFNQEALDNIFYSNKESNPRKKLKIEFLENKTKKKIILNLEKKKYSYHLSEPIFQINSINDIDTVKGNFEINYIFSYDSIHPALGKIIKKFDLFENSQCPVTGDEIDELSVGQTEFLFLNRAFTVHLSRQENKVFFFIQIP